MVDIGEGSDRARARVAKAVAAGGQILKGGLYTNDGGERMPYGGQVEEGARYEIRHCRQFIPVIGRNDGRVAVQYPPDGQYFEHGNGD